MPVKVGIFSRGIRRIPHLERFLDASIVAPSWGCFPQPVSAVAGWGRRATSRKAALYAQRHSIPYLSIEDGFLRSVDLGGRDAPLSLAVDDLGVHYDASQPSRLEVLIPRPLSGEEMHRTEAMIAAWREGRVSKYNHLREYDGALPARYVLAVDQTFGDASIAYGLASAASFQRMLQAALDEHPGSTVLLKVHPDVFAGKKRGHFDLEAVSRNPRVVLLREDAHPARLIEWADALYTVTSQMGFEGLLWGKPVRTFGMPFYAGWGLTQDEKSVPAGRRGQATLHQLTHAALIGYPHYIDPETGERCEAERVLDWMALQRRMRERFARRVHALGFSLQKKPVVRRFLQGSEVSFAGRADNAMGGDAVAIWGRGPVKGALPADVGLLRIEDGFLRSVGLGAEWVRPLSWVIDRSGIYYDAAHPSDLEHTLQTAAFDDDLLARARRLRERIVGEGLTKYNVGSGAWRRPAGAKRVILVPGQVETDASIAHGAPGLRRNIDLLRSVRADNPDAHLIYKPHPDVIAGLRVVGQNEDEASAACDELLASSSMDELLQQVDEVHVLTSLAGFEALLRGKRVVCYGQPFFSGWGLTTDIMPPARRSRRLSLDALVAGVLILYPTYVSRTTGRFTTPERAIDELIAWRRAAPPYPPPWRRIFRSILRLAAR